MLFSESLLLSLFMIISSMPLLYLARAELAIILPVNGVLYNNSLNLSSLQKLLTLLSPL